MLINKKIAGMKKINYLIITILLFAISCVPTFDEEGALTDSPDILEVIVGNENGKVPQINAIYADMFLDTVFLKDKSTDLSNLYLQGTIGKSCIIEPLEGASAFGTWGDFFPAGKIQGNIKYRANSRLDNCIGLLCSASRLFG